MYASSNPTRFAHLLVRVATQTGRDDGGGQGDAVLRLVVGQLGHAQRAGQHAVPVASVHRVGSGRERLALSAAVRGVAGGLAVDHVRGDRQHRLGVLRVAVRGLLADLRHEPPHDVGGDLVDPVVVVAEGREVALGDVVDHQPRLVADRAARWRT